MERYIQNEITADLKKKMVFVGGPRQVGKTTMSLGILGETSSILLILTGIIWTIKDCCSRGDYRQGNGW